MNNSNPLIPQGSLLEQKAKGKPHLRVAVFIVSIHLIFLGGLLIQGCRRDDPTASRTGTASTNDSSLPPLNPESLYTSSTNPPGFDLGATNALPQFSPETLPAPVTQEYVVVRGDSFFSIGTKFGVTSAAIARANPGVDSTRLKIGQKLTIPAAAVNGAKPSVAEASLGGPETIYVVKAGETLSRIGKAHGVSVNDIKELNGLKTDRINAGQKLKLPAARTPNTATNVNPAPLPPPPSGAGSL